MLTPAKKIFYAVEAVLFVAYNSKSGPVSSAALAEHQKLPPRYLEPLMQKLVRSGILRGVRGPTGGYVLGRERRRISLKDICDVIAENRHLPESLTPLGAQILHPEVENLLAQWEQALANVSMATLCDKAVVHQITPAYATATDFAI